MKKILFLTLILLLLFSFGCVQDPVDQFSNTEIPTVGGSLQSENGFSVLPLNNNANQETNNLTNEIELPTNTNVDTNTNVKYVITFNKVTVNITSNNYDKDLLESITIFGDPPEISKVMVDNKSVKYDFNQEFSNAGYLYNINYFANSNIEVEYSYDPDDFGGNYCMGQACIIRLWNDYISPTPFYYSLESGDYNLYDFSLDLEQMNPMFILTKDELYEEGGFILLKAQEKNLEESGFNLYKLRTLANKTETFTGKVNKKVTLFIVPGGLISAYYFNDSSIILIPAYESNQANATFVHEYSHFLLNESYFPMWIQEGLAEYISKKVTYSSCGTWIDTGYDVLDWGVYEIPEDKIAHMYGKVCSIFMEFDSKFGVDKTKELISEFEKLPDEDVDSENYLDKVESAIKKVSGQDISLGNFIEKKY